MENMLRKTWLIGIVILFVGASVLPSINANLEEADDIILRQGQSQPLTVFWEDNFDSYADGSSMHGQGGWKGWDNDPTYTAYVTSDQSLSSPHSVDIVENTDLIHEYSGYTSEQWTYTAWQYVPEDFSGSSYFILLSDYEDGAGQNNLWSVQIRFGSDPEIVEAEHGGPSLPLITGEWVELRVEIDLDEDWYEFYYGGDLLEEKEWTAGPNNDYTSILNIAAVDLYANFATSVYYDDMSLDIEAVASADLNCEGVLNWEEIEPDTTVTGNFIVENIGDPGSLLNWEIESYPSWGSWTFDPESGTDLSTGDPVTVEVEVVAPDEHNQHFTGEVKIVNSENPDDFCIINVSLMTLPAVPDLDCDGTLCWPEVITGSTITGTITVENVGVAGSLLDWEVDSYPDWGTWTFDPESGLDLTPEACPVIIDVEVVAPDDKYTDFTGAVKLVNSNNSSDFCEIDVALTTPVSRNMPFLDWIMERFPILGSLLERIFG